MIWHRTTSDEQMKRSSRSIKNGSASVPSAVNSCRRSSLSSTAWHTVSAASRNSSGSVRSLPDCRRLSSAAGFASASNRSPAAVSTPTDTAASSMLLSAVNIASHCARCPRSQLPTSCMRPVPGHAKMRFSRLAVCRAWGVSAPVLAPICPLIVRAVLLWHQRSALVRCCFHRANAVVSAECQ